MPALPELPSRFVVVRHLGTGGFADVYEVRDVESGRRLALKSFQCSSAVEVATIKSEFRAIGELRHPNLLGLGDLYEHGSRWCYTMELVEGPDIATWYRPEVLASGSGPFPTDTPSETVLRKVLLDLAEAISVLHQSGRLHQDIKPSNVLVTSAGRVVLIDYGLVRDRSAQVHELVGTPAYLAPECSRLDGQVSEASDWYAFGVLMFRILSGELPYLGNEVVLQLTKLAGPPRRERLEGAPDDLADLALALLAATPERRPGSAEILRRLGQRPRAEGGLRGSAEMAAIAEDRTGELRAELRESRVQTRCAFIEGAGTLDRTILVSRFCAEARAAGATMISSETHAREYTAFHGLHDLVDAIVAEVLRRPRAAQLELLPPNVAELAALSPAIARIAAIEAMPLGPGSERIVAAAAALASLVTGLAGGGPLILAIGGIHWWHVDALRVLERVLPGLPNAGLLLVLARDPTQGRSSLVSRIVAATGLPARALELARTATTATPSIAVDRLGPGARRVLDALALSVVALPIEVAMTVAQVAAGEVGACVTELTRSGGVVVVDGTLTLTVDPVPIRFQIDPAMETVWRRRIVDELEAASAEPAAIALAARDASDPERAARYAILAAAAAAEAGAMELAADLYRVAIDAGADDVETRLAWAHAARDAGHARVAADELLALADDDPARAHAHRRGAGMLLLQCGEIDRGLRVLRETDGVRVPRRATMTLAALGWARLGRLGRWKLATRARIDPEEVARVDVWWSAAGALGLVDSMNGALLQTRCVAMALAAGDPGRAARALASEAAFHAASLPARTKVDAILARATALADTVDDPHARAWIRACNGFVALLYGDWAAVILEAGAADEMLARLHGTHWERAAISHARVAALFFAGDLGALWTISHRQLADCTVRGDRFGATVARLAGVPLLLARGDLAAAGRVLEDAADGWPSTDHVQASFLALSRANVHLARGEGAAALAVIEASLAAMGLLLRVPLVRIPLEEAYVRAALMVLYGLDGAERRRMERRIRRMLARLDREPLAWARALAELHRGGLAGAAGDREAMVRHRLVAAAEFDALGMRMHAAIARARAGEPPAWSQASLFANWAAFAAIHAP